MTNAERRKLLFEFAQKQSLAVLSTVNSSKKPESALIEFIMLEDLTLVFDTLADKRKYSNLQQDPHVSFVIGWNDDNRTVQYEGIAKELEGTELLKYKKLYFDKLPDAKAFESIGDLRFFRVTPTWARYSDFSVDPWQIIELDFQK